MVNRKIVVVFLMALLCTCNVYAANDEQEKTEKVVVTGYGIDSDKAKENAIKNAVEQVIGVYIASDTIVKNNQLIKDEILQHSAGYIKQMNVISNTKNENGIYEVQINALVVASKLKSKIIDLHIATKEVAGESLFGEAISKIQMQKGAGDLLTSINAKYPQEAYVVTIGKLEVVSTDPNENNAMISIPISVKWNESFISALQDNIAQVAAKRIDRPDGNTIVNILEGQPSVCFGKIATIKNGYADACYVIDSVVYSRAIAKNQYGRNVLSLLSLKDGENKEMTKAGFTGLPLTIFFKNKNGDVIEEATWNIQSDSVFQQGLRGGIKINEYSKDRLYELGNRPPNIYWVPYGWVSNNTFFISDGTYQEIIKARINAKSLESITAIEIKANSWTN